MNKIHKTLAIAAAAMIAGIAVATIIHNKDLSDLLLSEVEALSSYEYRIRIDYSYTYEKMGYEDQEINMPCSSQGDMCSISYLDSKGHPYTITISGLKNS